MWASPPTYRLPKAYAYPTGRTEPSAPTPVYRTRTLFLPCHSEPVTDVTGVGIRLAAPAGAESPCLPLRGGPVLAAKQVPLGCTLGRAAKRSGGGAKRRRERYAAAAPRHTGRCTPRVLVPLRSTAWASPPTYRLPKAYAYPTGRTEPSAPTPGFPAANALSKPNQRPKAATYLCRSAAKARFDNRLNHW